MVTTGTAETGADVVGRFGDRITREFLLVALTLSIKCELRSSAGNEKRRERNRRFEKRGKGTREVILRL